MNDIQILPRNPYVTSSEELAGLLIAFVVSVILGWFLCLTWQALLFLCSNEKRSKNND